jgi:hypothetical protein
MTVAVASVLSAVVFPCLTGLRSSARLATCATQLHHVGAALACYTTDARHRFPPFLFSTSFNPSLSLSGHYGGDGPPDFFRLPGAGDRDVNLHALRREGMLDESQLICPGASVGVRQQQTGYFRQGQFSTYGLRMPYTYDLWPARTPPPGLDSDALNAYRFVAGGQVAPCASVGYIVPQLRVDRSYTMDVGGGGTFDPAADAVVSDLFIDQAYSDPVGGIERGWCHGARFNVLRGDGAVRPVRDDGTVRSNSSPPGTTRSVDGLYNAESAEAVWRFFDRATR